MKNYFLLIACFISISLFSQNFPDFNDYEITKHEDGFHFKGSSEEIVNTPPEYENKDEWDTLFISLDSPVFELFVVGPDYHYSNITWISSTFGYIKLYNEHTYTIFAQWWENLDCYCDVKEDYSINGTDTLGFSKLNSIHELVLNPVNQDGIPFNETGVHTFSGIYMFISEGEGYFPRRILCHLGGTAFFSFVSEDIPILCSSGCTDVYNNNYLCFTEFPQLNGINQNHILTNDHNDFIESNVQFYFTNEDIPYCNVGMYSGILYKDFLGSFVYTFGGLASGLEHTEYWDGQVFINKYDYGSYKSITGLMGGTGYDETIISWYDSPFFELINDSIYTYFHENPPYNVSKVGNEDTLFFGESPLRPGARWFNNYDNGIQAAFKNYGFGGEHFIFPINNEVLYKLMDNNGNVLVESEGSEYLYYPEALAESYELEITYDAVPLEDGFGRAKMVANFASDSVDSSPPNLTTIQFRNSSNKPVYKINSGDELNLLFSAADFNDYYITISGSDYVKYLYQPVIDDATKVFIKEYDEEIWQEVMIENTHEDTVYGIYYQASLSEFLNVGNTAYDLKINIKDFNSNACEFLFNPAILVDDFTLSITEQKLISKNNDLFSIHPNPASDIIYVDNLENKKLEAITLFDINGKMIKQFHQNMNELDISKVSPGVYYLIINHKEGEAIEKIVIQ